MYHNISCNIYRNCYLTIRTNFKRLFTLLTDPCGIHKMHNICSIKYPNSLCYLNILNMINFKNKHLENFFFKYVFVPIIKTNQFGNCLKRYYFVINNSYYLLSNHHVNSQLTDHDCFRNHVLILPFKRGRWRGTCQKIGTV